MDDIDITVDGQITEGDVAAARWSGTMTHKATGTKIPLSGILHVKVKDGQATYGWNSHRLAAGALHPWLRPARRDGPALRRLSASGCRKLGRGR